MKQNIKTIEIHIPNEIILKRIVSTPTLKNLIRGDLKIGKNILNVNHFTYSKIVNIFPTIMGVTVVEVVND